MGRKNLAKAIETAVILKATGWQVQLLPAASLLVALENRLVRAVELMALARHHPAGATGWLENFPLITRLHARLKMELSPAALQDAQYCGRRLGLKKTVESLLMELSEPRGGSTPSTHV